MNMLKSPPVAPWRQILRTNFYSWKALAEFLELTEDQQQKIAVQPRFPLNVPRRLAMKIEKGTLDDPILRQFLPSLAEQGSLPGFTCDPVEDERFKRSSKLLQKYQGRALILCTSACAMHCRYCFRQNFDYDVEDKLFEEEVSLLREDPSIQEAILSGGDPLSLSNACLGKLVQDLCTIPHIKRIRFHSRFPIGIPERIDEGFLEILRTAVPQILFITHANHPKELDPEVLASLKKMQLIGVAVLNQSVLLRDVNDDAGTLKALSELLVDNGIIPYYLHQLDRVQGAARFEVSVEKGKHLIEEISKQLPGYAIPKYVQEIAGKPGKTPL